MRHSANYALMTAIGLALVVTSGAALANHGKVGLWAVSTTMNMSGVSSMPDMSKLPPEAQAQMKKMGLQMNGNTLSTQHCMTAAEVAQDQPQGIEHMKNCAMKNMHMSGGAMNADLVCTNGDVVGKGHISMTYVGNTSYSGSMNFSGTSHGQPMNMNNTMSGHWISANCGSVTH